MSCDSDKVENEAKVTVASNKKLCKLHVALGVLLADAMGMLIIKDKYNKRLPRKLSVKSLMHVLRTTLRPFALCADMLPRSLSAW